MKCAPIWIKTDNLVNEYVVGGKRAFFHGRTGWKPRSRLDGLSTPPFKILWGVRFGFNVESHNHWLDEASRFEFMGWMARHYFHPVKCVRAQIDVTVAESIPAGIFVLRLANETKEMRRLRAFIDFILDIRPLNSEANSHDYEIWWDREHLSAIARRYGQPVHVFVYSTSFTERYRLGDFHGELDSGGLPGTDETNYKQRAGERSWLEVLDEDVEGGGMRQIVVGCGSSFNFPSDFDECVRRLLASDVSPLEYKRDIYLNLTSACSTLHSTDVELDRAYMGAKMNIEALKFSHPLLGLGVLSGLPQSAFFGGRDACLTTLAMSRYGDFNAVRKTLKTLEARRARLPGFSMGFRYYSGEIPDKIFMDGSTMFKGADVTPLFILAVDDYLRWSGDRDFLQHIKHLVRDATWTFKDHDEDRDGLIDHGNFCTWMREVSRGKSAVEVQGVWAQALEAAARISEQSGETSRTRELRRHSSRLRELIVKRFWNQDTGWFYDRIDERGRPDTNITANPLMLLVSSLVPGKEARTIFRRLESREFTTGWGVRAYSKSNSDYNGRELYRGNVWSLVTGWAAISELNYGRAYEGQRYLNTLKKLTKIQMYGAIPENLQGDRPIPCGCPLQGAASSMLIRGIFDGLLGLTPNAFANEIALQPTLVNGVSLKLDCIRVGGTLVDLEVSSASRKVKIKSSKALRATIALPMEREDESSKVEVRGATIKAIGTRKSLRGLRVAVSVDLRGKRTTTILLSN